MIYRFRYHLQMCQQNGYKPAEIAHWQRQYLRAKVLTAEHLYFGLVLLVLLFFLSPGLTHTAVAILLSLFVLFWFGSPRRYRAKDEKKPLVMTPRAWRLTATAGALTGIVLLTGGLISVLKEIPSLGLSLRYTGGPELLADPYFLFFSLLVSDLLIPGFLLLSSLLVLPVETRIQNGFKKQAMAKLASAPDLKVIALTGSYGKTSTKFMVSTLLEERYSVCTTPGSYNTPMGICKVVNQDLTPSHRYLILEMGARYEGNIEELCDLARPDISIVTTVGPAHLETFGTIETIAHEKAALVRRVSPNGIVILNGDQPLTAQMANLREDVTIISATLDSVKARNSQHPVVAAENVRYTRNGCEFELLLCNLDTLRSGSSMVDAVSASPNTPSTCTSVHVQLRLLGEHNVMNFLLAAGAAAALGLRGETIAIAAQRIKPVEHRLEMKERNGRIILDDAFNSNPVGAKNAVDVLMAVEGGKKVLITPGMVELGDLQDELNREFGRQIAQAAPDQVLLVGPRQTQPILEGILETNPSQSVKQVRTLFEANDWIDSYTSAGDVILYENDLPDSYNE